MVNVVVVGALCMCTGCTTDVHISRSRLTLFCVCRALVQVPLRLASASFPFATSPHRHCRVSWGLHSRRSSCVEDATTHDLSYRSTADLSQIY